MRVLGEHKKRHLTQTGVVREGFPEEGIIKLNPEAR